MPWDQVKTCTASVRHVLQVLREEDALRRDERDTPLKAFDCVFNHQGTTSKNCPDRHRHVCWDADASEEGRS